MFIRVTGLAVLPVNGFRWRENEPCRTERYPTAHGQVGRQCQKCFVKPLTPETQKTSPEFYNILNFILQFSPTHPSEKDLMARFAKIGVGPRKALDASKLAPEIKTAIKQGKADAWADFAILKKKIDSKEVTSGYMLGSRKSLKNNYLYRMGGAVVGISGNYKQEAIYPIYAVDSEGQPLDAVKSRYTIRFAPGQLPPVDAFWSLAPWSG